jgi:hypothetical protein
VLNLLLYGLTGRPVDDQLMEFLAVDEHLVDIGDDLVDYEVSVFFSSSKSQSADLPVLVAVQCLPCHIITGLLGRVPVQDDVMANSFNIYRGTH